MNIINRKIIIIFFLNSISSIFQTIYELYLWYLNAHLCKNWFWQFEELVASMPCPKSTEPILRHLQTYIMYSWYIPLMIAIGLMLLEQSIRFWPKNLQNHLFGISHCSKRMTKISAIIIKNSKIKFSIKPCTLKDILMYQKVQIVLGQTISKNWRDPELQKWHFFVVNFRALCFWHFYDARWHHIMSAWLQKKGFFSPKEKGQWPCLLKTQWYNFESKNMQFKYISRKKIQLLTSC